MNHRQITVRKGNFKREMAAAKISLWAHHNFFFTHFFSFISLPVTVPALVLFLFLFLFLFLRVFPFLPLMLAATISAVS